MGEKEQRDGFNDIAVLKTQYILSQVTNLNFGNDFQKLLVDLFLDKKEE